MDIKKYLLLVKQGLLKEKLEISLDFYICMGSYVENFLVVKDYKSILALPYDVCTIYGEKAIKDFEENHAIFYSDHPRISYMEIQNKFLAYKNELGINEALKRIINEYTDRKKR